MRVGLALWWGLVGCADVTDLADAAFDPVEDPAVAVLMAGAPQRVLLTVVDGVLRYRRSADAQRLAAAVAAAEPARRRMIEDRD